MSGGERLVGTGAVLMVLCCAGGPLVAAAVGGGLIAGAGVLGAVCGAVLLLSVRRAVRPLSAQLPRMLTSRWLLPALIVAAAALFAVGTTIERNQGDHHGRASSAAGQSESASTGETTIERAAESGSAGGDTTATTTRATEGGESRVFGLDAESPALIALAVAASLALAWALLRWRGRVWLLALVGLAMLAFAALDIREASHQIDTDRTSLVIIAVAALHLIGAALSAEEARRRAY
jgi:hypothetical protein